MSEAAPTSPEKKKKRDWKKTAATVGAVVLGAAVLL